MNIYRNLVLHMNICNKYVYAKIDILMFMYKSLKIYD